SSYPLGPLSFRPDPATAGEILSLPGPWTAATATAESYPRFTPEPRITGLGNLARPELLPAFSGTVRYETEFDGQAASGVGTVLLDLGAVYEIAEVAVNDQLVGVRICPPYTFDITAKVESGRNRLRIDVTNTLAKQIHDSVFDRMAAQEPTGLIGPVRILALPQLTPQGR
ncbi:MAG: glycosyl transferase family 2, partial [Kiritimatiellae bacterium]|nr:glycosyl transferase family 2 [Kiritimatiellia bacterium]